MVKHKKRTHAKKKQEESHSKNETKGSKLTWLWVGLLIVILAVAALAMTGTFSNEPTSAVVAPSADAVKVDFYVMSQCPYGTQVEDAIAPVLEKLGNDIDFNLEYIANVNADGTFSSLHGQPEVDGNIAQLCAIKHNPDKYMDMIECQNKDARAIPGNWETCAQDNGLDIANIKSCYEGEEGKELLKESIAKSEAVGASGSPTIYINDEKYAGGRGENDFMRAICNAYEDDRPNACSEIPEPITVNTIIINDKRCESCSTEQIISSLKSIYPGLEIVEYDYSEAEGKKMYDELDLKLLPALLFDDTIKKAENYAQVEKYLDPKGALTALRIGAQFDPSAEICDNEIDDTGNGQVDCADSTCANSMECREEKKDHLQVFIMSDCPYGRKAIVALDEVVDNVPDMEYEVHYIASESGNGFSSLHGRMKELMR